MLISRIDIHNLRVIQQASLRPEPGINLVFGKNGSGKTSLMEAISLLGYSRSFLPGETKELIRFGEDQLQVFAEIHPPNDLPSHKVGFGYHHKDGKNLKHNGIRSKTEEIVRLIPLIVLSPKSFDIVEGGSSERRKRVDWGLFHVKHSFQGEWRKYKKLLLQRNAALKNARSFDEIRHWTQALADSSEKIQQMRSEHVEQLLPKVYKNMVDLGLDLPVSIEEYPGWGQSGSLLDQLEQGFAGEKKAGFTRRGAHKYDLKIQNQGHNAKHALSRGEKKRLLCAFLFAQMEVLEQEKKNTVVVLDDLTSEFDDEAIGLFVDRIQKTKKQTFITAIENNNQIRRLVPASTAVFHVKHGQIQQS